MLTINEDQPLKHILIDIKIFIIAVTSSAQRVPEPDPLPGIFFDTRPDPIQF